MTNLRQVFECHPMLQETHDTVGTIVKDNALVTTDPPAPDRPANGPHLGSRTFRRTNLGAGTVRDHAAIEVVFANELRRTRARLGQLLA